MNEKAKNRIRNLEGLQGHKKNYSISARMGKHYCPKCKVLLQIKRKERVVNSESEEAKDFDFSSGGLAFGPSRAIGNVKFTWDVFYCEKCDLEISIKNMKIYENKKKGKKEKVRSEARKAIGLILFFVLAIMVTFVWHYFF